MVTRNVCVVLAVAIIMLFSVTTSFAASKAEIDTRVKEAIATFYKTPSVGKELPEKANGMLVFPRVIKAVLELAGNAERARW